MRSREVSGTLLGDLGKDICPLRLGLGPCFCVTDVQESHDQAWETGDTALPVFELCLFLNTGGTRQSTVLVLQSSQIKYLPSKAASVISIRIIFPCQCGSQPALWVVLWRVSSTWDPRVGAAGSIPGTVRPPVLQVSQT